MNFRILFKAFCSDAFHELKDMGELPRPPFNVPTIADNVYFTHRLSQLPSHKQLQNYMRSSGLSDKLRNIGHTIFWHDEVFEWLFLERVIAINSDVPMDDAAFKKVFLRAQAEISRSSYRIRRITIINGLPKLSNPIALYKDVVLSTKDSHIYHDLPRLLGRLFQDINREPSLWVDPDNRLLIQTHAIIKGNKGDNLQQELNQMRNQAETVIKALRLSLNTQIYPKAVYLSYLSCFPLYSYYAKGI